MVKEQKIACLVCGHKTIMHRGSFEICPVCFWEEEGAVDQPNAPKGGPNGNLSLNQARANYEKFGAIEERFVSLVRLPARDE